MEKVQSMMNTRMLYLLSWIQSLILFANAQSKLWSNFRIPRNSFTCH